MMTRTEQVNELAAALAAAQGAILNAKRESENPHFRHRYADLAAIWDACRAALSAHGLSVVQSPRLIAAADGAIWLVEVETTLLHQSGQSVSDVLAVPVAATTPQGIGSAITYARRYSLAAFVGVAPEDDDAQAGSGHDRDLREERPPKKAPAPPRPPRPAAGAPAPPTDHVVTVKVLGILKRSVGDDGRVKYVITADDQRTYLTPRVEDAQAAKAAQEAGVPIEISYAATEHGRVIRALRELQPEKEA